MADLNKTIKALEKNQEKLQQNLSDEKFKKLLNDVKDRNAFAVAELGIGTNRKAKIIGEVLVDEKAYGTAHIAFGSNKAMGGTLDVQIHVDGVFSKPTITADGETIIKDGELL